MKVLNTGLRGKFEYPKNKLLTDEQRDNMKGLGLQVTDKTTEADCLKVLRKKKFIGFGEHLRTKVSCD